ncbi:MAG TPA: DNA polymerase III subunit alpha, partial [Acidimicrobiales bacterium]|nr:DNA polymerase III subunit alpha [Acidimicrobiales bacterium]
IATTGCLGGVVLQALLRGDVAEATKLTARFRDIFGDRLYVELQDHGMDAQRRTNRHLVEIARDLGVPLLATNDSHYVHREDSVAQDALLCVQTGAQVDDPKRFKFETDQHWLKTAAEMRALFAELPEACDSTLEIAERANVEIEFGKPELPRFDVPPGFDSEDAYLRHLTLQGAHERYGAPLAAEAAQRIDRELEVIRDMGLSAYFLIVWDLIRHAREAGIRVGPGRGSAAGCCVAYCLKIVDLDPLKYGLIFERFLNAGRKEMPDIDMDFDERYRGEMIRYAAERYGPDHVAQIVTFSTIKARAAVRDAARVLGYPYSVGDRIAKAMPPLVMGRDTPLAACLEVTPGFEEGYKMAADLRELHDTDPDAKKVIEVAKGLAGLRRQDGIHAAAVVITREKLTEYLPIQRKPGPDGDIANAPIVTQYEMHGVSDLGLLKMDFLGLRNLSVIEKALDLIESTTGERVDIDHIPLDDEKTFEMLRRGDSIGVFQLEGGPMRALIRSLAPTCFDDIGALVALYRPGPMAANMHNDFADRKNGRKPVTYLHPDAEEVLSKTYGLCLTGDTIVHDVRTGRPHRLDEVGGMQGFQIQGVDENLLPARAVVTHWVCNGERDTLELRLANGMSVAGTPDHPVLTYDGWKQIGDLCRDDLVAVPRSLLPGEHLGEVDRDRLRVLGYLLADGSLAVGSVIRFINTDDDVLAAFRSAVSRAFPSTRVATASYGGVVHLTDGNGRGTGGGASPLLRWLREVGVKYPAGSAPGGPTSEYKVIPDCVFELANDDIAFFLGALWDCDGHVNLRSAHYKTISPRRANQVQALLMRLGFEAPIHRSTCPPRPDGSPVFRYQVTVHDGDRFTRLVGRHMASSAKARVLSAAGPRGPTLARRDVAAAVGGATTEPLRVLAERVGVQRWQFAPYATERHPRLHLGTGQQLIDEYGLTELTRLTNVNWIRVDTVVPAGRRPVYDITVEGIHNFVANGIVAHNCIYQEEVMRVAQRFAGYSLQEADNLRKACAKKVRSLMAKEREKFVAGCEATGYGAQLGNEWFDIIEPFADYAFPKAHAYCYGMVAYQTAWLKANYPVEYLAALLTSVKDDKDKTAVYLAECRTMGIDVLVPDINKSMSDFVAVDAKIPFGLSAIRNVGEGLVAMIVAERDENGPFADFYDFCARVSPAVLNKRSVESLIKAGAFDSLGHPRRGLLMVFEQVIDRTLARRRERDMGIQSLFGDLDDGPGSLMDERTPVPDLEFDPPERLAHEKEMLGLYVSSHPLFGVESALRRHTDCTINDLRELRDG